MSEMFRGPKFHGPEHIASKEVLQAALSRLQEDWNSTVKGSRFKNLTERGWERSGDAKGSENAQDDLALNRSGGPARYENYLRHPDFPGATIVISNFERDDTGGYQEGSYRAYPKVEPDTLGSPVELTDDWEVK